jgi:ABC-type branched-subunit amino acid transport system ATPase component
MIIREVHVKNFRSILGEPFPCDCLTVLVGRNGAGKLSFLRALEKFYDPSAKVIDEDFYAEDTSQHTLQEPSPFSVARGQQGPTLLDGYKVHDPTDAGAEGFVSQRGKSPMMENHPCD